MIEYKGYKIIPFSFSYDNKKFTNFEICKIENNATKVFYKNNGVAPATATLSDSHFDTVEEAKKAIDDEQLIFGGAFLDGIHWASAKTVGRTWHCDFCGKDFYADRVSPQADTESYGLLCQQCFEHLKKTRAEKGKPFHYIEYPTDYDIKENN